MVILMPDYEKMYHIMFNATEEAINLLIAAQQKCEDIYCSGENAEIVLLNDNEEKSEQKNINRVNF